jgi:uncharacterized membrane protein YhaH (DUF805 family)
MTLIFGLILILIFALILIFILIFTQAQPPIAFGISPKGKQDVR